jgi:hypothetical protein
MSLLTSPRPGGPRLIRHGRALLAGPRTTAWLAGRSRRRERLGSGEYRLTAAGRRVLARAVDAWRLIQAEVVQKTGAKEWERLRVELDDLRALSR